MTCYFDNAATTRACPEAVSAAVEAMTEDYGNPSSGHAPGRRAASLLRGSRGSVAEALGASEEEVFFTSGGTEGDNWALLGAARAAWRHGKHLITGASEHDAVRRTARRLESQGWSVTYLRPDKSGRVPVQAVEDAVREDTSVVSLMLVNNETGAVNPIGDIFRMLRAKAPQAVLHTDAVQGFLKVPFTARSLGADLITVSSHKIHGPKGAGALYIRRGVRLEGLLTGGGQERGLRPGTEAMPALLGFGAAARVGRERFAGNVARMESVKERLREDLASALPDAVIIGCPEAPHILNVSLPGYGSEVLMNALDAAGISVSRSSACRKGARSHVLEAMGLPEEVIDGALRVSLSEYSTPEEADYFVETLRDIAMRLRTRKRGGHG